MTSSADPPLVRERATIGTLRSRGAFQIVFGALFLVFAVVAAVSGAAWWTVTIAVVAGVLVGASGVVAWRIARARLLRFEDEHGAGAGLRRPAGPRDAAPATDAADGPSTSGPEPPA